MYLVVLNFLFLLFFVIVLICHFLTTKLRICKIDEIVQTGEFNINFNIQKGATYLYITSKRFWVVPWESQGILNVHFGK